MNQESLEEYCRSVYDLFRIPVMIYDKKNGNIRRSFFFDESFSELFIENPQITKRYLGTSLFDPDDDVSFYISDDLIAFGSVNDRHSSLAVYIGPCLLADPGETMMTSMLTRSNSPFRKVPKRYYDQIYAYIRKLPRFSQERFLWLLSFSFNFLNHEVKDPEDFHQVSIRKDRIDLKEKDISRIDASSVFDYRNYADFTEELKALILAGPADNALGLFENNVPFFFSSLSSLKGELDELRYLKNRYLLFLGSLSQGCRELHISEKALLDLYNELMQDLESCIISQQIQTLYRKTISAFCDLVSRSKAEQSGGNVLIANALSYIHDHINETISASDIARHIGVSRGYLSYLFNSQVHMKISDYISKEKIELSKSLLRSTNNSIVDIANYLSFSSQSHFNNTFKKLTGMTPLAYRRSA